MVCNDCYQRRDRVHRLSVINRVCAVRFRFMFDTGDRCVRLDNWAAVAGAAQQTVFRYSSIQPGIGLEQLVDDGRPTGLRSNTTGGVFQCMNNFMDIFNNNNNNKRKKKRAEYYRLVEWGGGTPSIPRP